MRMTPQGKIVLALIVVGLVVVGVWKWGGVGSRDRGGTESSASARRQGGLLSRVGLGGDKVGTPERPLKVGVNVWVGCVAGLVANGGKTTTEDSIFRTKYDLDVEFEIIDDWQARPLALQSGDIDVNLTTTDIFAIEHSRYAQNDFDARAILMVDWSRGGDGIAAANSIQRVEDLKGRKVACSQYTPSHYLLLYLLKNSNLSTAEVDNLMRGVTWMKDGVETAIAFAAGNVDAAVAWEPDMSDAIAKRGNARVLVSTRSASKLIADILVAGETFCDEHPDTMEKFVRGWLDGVEYIKSNPQEAAQIIERVKEFNIPADLAQAMLEGVVLSDYGENAAFFGLGEDQPADFNNIFDSAAAIWRDELVISRITDSADARDTRFLEAVAGDYPQEPAEPEPELPAPTPEVQQQTSPLLGRKLTINFATDSDQIEAGSLNTIDQVGDVMQSLANTYVRIEGNTDSVGNRAYNVQLSTRRAEAVKRHLMQKYGFSANRFIVVGNGPDKPIASNDTPEGRAQNRRTDFTVLTAE